MDIGSLFNNHKKINDVDDKKPKPKLKAKVKECTSQTNKINSHHHVSATTDKLSQSSNGIKKNTHKIKKVAATAVVSGAATGAGVGIASGIKSSEPFNKEQFSHILKKDTPIDEMVIIGQHNAGSLPGSGTLYPVSNQSMSIYETLDKTPVRGFDLDLWKHNDEVVINHGNIYDPFVKDEDITRLQDSLNDMKSWLDKPQNNDEVIFLNIENPENLSTSMLRDTFGHNAILTQYNYYLKDFGKTPTVNELREKGIKVVVFHSEYKDRNSSNLSLDSYVNIENTWEDRSMQQLAHGLHNKVPGKITTDDVDKIISSGKGHYISLDQISPNDPRFYQPQDRSSLNLKPDIDIMGLFYVSDTTASSFLLGTGVASSSTSIALTGVISAFQGYANEMQIRKQDTLLPGQLANVELGGVLSARKKNKKKNTDFDEILTTPITIEEVKEAYKKDMLFNIKKNTAIAGVSGTTTLSSSMLALGMLFPPVAAAFCGTAAAVGGAGLIATAIATANNKRRLNEAIDKAFELDSIKKALDHRVEIMNELLSNKAEDKKTIHNMDSQQIVNDLITTSSDTSKLIVGSTILTASNLATRISSIGKYSVSAIGIGCVGIGAALTALFAGVSGALNYKTRRKKLENISTLVKDVTKPQLGKKQKRKLGIFGDTAIERFIKKDEENLKKALKLPDSTTFKDAFIELMLPQNASIFEKYITDFSLQKWQKDLTKFAKNQKPALDFTEVAKDENQLDILLKKYMVRKSAKFASRDTWKQGLLSSISLAAVGCFCGLLFTPLVAIPTFIAIATIGGGVSKIAAMRESRIFAKKVSGILDSEPNRLNKEDLMHRQQLDRMLNGWKQMFYQEKSQDKTLLGVDNLSDAGDTSNL